MIKIKQILCGNDYDSGIEEETVFSSVKELLAAATPKNWNVDDWKKVDEDKYKLGETSIYIIVEKDEKQKMVIASDSCNGEEAQFLAWMEKNHPEIDSSIENTDMGGLFEWNEEFQEWQLVADTYWDQYCSE